MRASKVRRAIILASVLLVAACGGNPPSGGVAGKTAAPEPSPTATASASPAPTASPTPTVTPTVAPTVAPTPTPTVAPTATPTVAPPFLCEGAATGGSAAARSAVADVRIGQHEGYDRFVVEFTGAIPAYRVTIQPGTTFTLSPRGTDVQLAGTSGILVWFSPVADWTSYSGATSFTPGYPVLREARQIENFEGIQQWGLGVQGPPCLRVFTLDGPSRLVVDVATAG